MHDQTRGGILRRLFAIDARSLALFRISIGAVLLVDLLSRGADIQQHYSDLGVLPREALWQVFLLGEWHWSLHALTGSVAGITFLFAIAIAGAVALILGYRTRMAVVLSWLLLASLHARNPILQYGGDNLLRMLLFWSMFLPLAGAWSIDRLRGVVPPGRPASHLSMASAAILVQMFMLYFFSSLFKRNDTWQGGEGMVLAMSSDMFSRPLAHHLLEYPYLLEQASHVVPWLQLLLPFLLFAPFATPWFRMLAVLLLAGFHLAIELVLATGIFQYVCLSGLILFLPGEFWNRLAGAKVIPGKVQAIAAAAKARLSLALHRDGPSGPKPHKKWATGLLQLVVGGLFVYVVAWNIATLKVDEYSRQHGKQWMSEGTGGPIVYRLMLTDYAVERMFGSIGWIGRVAVLHQHWAMFQMGGGSVSGWHVLVGTLEDGQEISLLEGGAPITGEANRKPAQVGDLYSNTRWRVYYRYLRYAAALRQFLPGVVSREWNQQHPDQQITRLKISYFLEVKRPAGEAPGLEEFVWYEGPVPVDSSP